jgi:hypothetical protein
MVRQPRANRKPHRRGRESRILHEEASMSNRSWAAACGFAVAACAALALVAAAAPLAAAPASACSIDGVERVVAIGDVHGAADRFAAILKTTGLVDDKLHWAGGRAHLVQTGDVVDRGPDSRRALDLIRQLEKEAERAGGAVHALIGNHEVMRMLGDLRYVAPGEYEAFQTNRSEETRKKFVEQAPPDTRDKALAQTPLGQVEMRIAFGHEGEYGKWIRTHDAVARINGVLFLHGGISPAVAAQSCDDINATVRRELTADLDKTRAAPLSSLTAREDGPLWYRGLTQIAEPEIDDVLAKQHVTAIVVGHTVTPTGRVTPRFGGKVVMIDTGMQPAYVPQGRASAVEFKNGTVTAIYVDSREVVR